MKFLLRSLLSVVLVAFAGTVFAADITCPPLGDQIRNVKFADGYQNGEYWYVISEQFKFEDNGWNVGVVMKAPQVTSIAEAIQVVQNKIISAALTEPRIKQDRAGTVCHYSSDAEFIVAAINPPIFPPSQLFSRMR